MLVLERLVLQPVQPLLVHVCPLGPSDSPACSPLSRESSACPPALGNLAHECGRWTCLCSRWSHLTTDHRPRTCRTSETYMPALCCAEVQQAGRHSCTLPCTELCTVLLCGAFFTYNKHKDTRPTYIIPVWRAKTSC